MLAVRPAYLVNEISRGLNRALAQARFPSEDDCRTRQGGGWREIGCRNESRVTSNGSWAPIRDSG